jgi:hypothetical protein
MIADTEFKELNLNLVRICLDVKRSPLRKALRRRDVLDFERTDDVVCIVFLSGVTVTGSLWDSSKHSYRLKRLEKSRNPVDL